MNAGGSSISCYHRTTLQCGKCGQGWNLGCQGVKYQRRKGAPAIVEIVRRSKFGIGSSARTCVTSQVALTSLRHKHRAIIPGRPHMTWKTPKIVEVPAGMEINMYACSALT